MTKLQIKKIARPSLHNTLMVALFFFAFAEAESQESFLTQQLRYQRVRQAVDTGKGLWEEIQEITGIENAEILLVAYKKEEKLEVWAGENQKFQKVRTYDFCAFSGELGPKRREGDLQIPEGVYYLSAFNPYSNFHLSLGINYPNASDKLRSDKDRPGNNIFIHGGCATIGCIPIKDQGIREVYIAAVMAKSGGQNRIHILIFPFKMDEERLTEYVSDPDYIKHEGLWRELMPIDQAIRTKGLLPKVGVNKDGSYYIEGK